MTYWGQRRHGAATLSKGIVMGDVPAVTPGPWIFERHESALELARLTGKTLEIHEGYFRANDGAWIVTYAAAEGDDFGGGTICEVSFKGNAKRGEKHGGDRHAV